METALNPLVTVVILNYNQGKYVGEAIRSVLNQSYQHIELIIVDDASTDDSVQVIKEILALHPQIQFIANASNLGNCASFNLAWRRGQGTYVIDLAADDVLHPDRVAIGVRELQRSGSRYGVHFSDAWWMDESGKPLFRHSEKYPHDTIPQGDIYLELIHRFFICSPTMMMTKACMVAVDGYDESLHYEDFDFWIRSARKFWYCYSPDALVSKRVVRDSLSAKQFRIFSPHQRSTLIICHKISALNQNNDERKALSKRILYEMRVCIKTLRVDLIPEYLLLWIKNRRRKF